MTPYYDPNRPPVGAPPPQPPRGMSPVILLIILMGVGAMLLVGGFVAFAIYEGVKEARDEEKAAASGADAATVDAAPPAARVKAKLPPIERHVPHHPASFLAGCSDADVEALSGGIDGAIEVGAPLYNAGNFAACFHMYEGTAADLERKLTASCTGPRRALEAARTRAATLEGPSAQAWAMRDAFDGVVEVIARRGTGQQ